MKSPFVSRALYEATADRAASEHENAQILRAEMVDREKRFHTMLKEAKAEYADLLDKYHALREKGYGHLEALPIAPKADQFGPRTRAALDYMSKGLSRDVRVAMEAKAAALVAEGADDGHVADAVRRGEPLRVA